MMYCAKDFVETEEGLVFALVESGEQQGRVLAFLRYIADGERWRKLNTDQANQYLQGNYPEYLYHCPLRDAHLHGVPITRISRHHSARSRTRQLMQMPAVDQAHKDFHRLLELFRTCSIDFDGIGVTGSLLIGAQNEQSDIDLVVYDRLRFNDIRTVIGQLIKRDQLQALTADDWRQSYQRRGCELSLEEYQWHERRKLNKALINGRKFDLSFASPTAQALLHNSKKGRAELIANIVDDRQAFDYPARYLIDHPEIDEIVCYTATYVGQAFNDETIRAAGQLEQAETGKLSLLIGSSREAVGEYLKVLV